MFNTNLINEENIVKSHLNKEMLTDLHNFGYNYKPKFIS